MDGRVSRLAARFKKAVRDESQARRDAEDAAARAGESARRARTALLAELLELAEQIGAVRASREGDGVTLRYGERYLHFEPEGDHDRVTVEFEGAGDEVHYLYRQAELGDRWVYVRQKRFRDDRVPLYDAGIEELLVRGLGMPRPGEDAGDDDPNDGGPAEASGRKRL